MAERVTTPTPQRQPTTPTIPSDYEPVEGASEHFVPQTTTDIPQHAPGPHGQGDEPTSAPAGRFNYEESDVPKVRKPADR